ncbi:MAG: hypothetical protein JO264_08935 [Acidisphaera sp.]|nr:hypothetical protein [Acidisphaera sp.]
MLAATFLGFVLTALWSPAGFIGFCCGLSRSLLAVIIGALVATVIQYLLVLAVSPTGIDPLLMVTTPVAALLAGAIGWGVARIFAGPRQPVTGEPDGYMEIGDLGRPSMIEPSSQPFEEGHQPG